MKVILIMLLLIVSVYGSDATIHGTKIVGNSTVYQVTVDYTAGDSDSEISIKDTMMLEAKKAVANTIGSVVITNTRIHQLNNAQISEVNGDIINVAISKATVSRMVNRDNKYKAFILVYVDNSKQSQIESITKKYVGTLANSTTDVIPPLVFNSTISNIGDVNDQIIKDTSTNNFNTRASIVEQKVKMLTINELKANNIHVSTRYVGVEHTAVNENTYTFETKVSIDEDAILTYIRDNNPGVKIKMEQNSDSDKIAGGIFSKVLLYSNNGNYRGECTVQVNYTSIGIAKNYNIPDLSINISVLGSNVKHILLSKYINTNFVYVTKVTLRTHVSDSCTKYQEHIDAYNKELNEPDIKANPFGKYLLNLKYNRYIDVLFVDLECPVDLKKLVDNFKVTLN